jgi:hypothetical protein
MFKVYLSSVSGSFAIFGGQEFFFQEYDHEPTGEEVIADMIAAGRNPEFYNWVVYRVK